MKNRSLTLSLLLVTLSLALCAEVSAQKNAAAEKPKDTSLDKSLEQLGEILREAVVVEQNQWTGTTRTYVRLKQRGDCNISFQVSRVAAQPRVNQTNQPPTELTFGDWRLNLSELDVAQVKLTSSPQGDYLTLRFGTTAGKESIKWTGLAAGESGWNSEGWFKVSRKQAAPAAAALEQAIRACNK